MRFRLERELRRGAPPPHFNVVRRASPRRHRFVRNIRHARHQAPERLIERLGLLVERRNALAGFTHLLLALSRVLTGLAQPGDFLALRITLRLEERRVGKECRSRWSP